MTRIYNNKDIVFEYHERTKHSFQRFSASLDYLDWNNQPYPFRIFQGTTQFELKVSNQIPALLYHELYNLNRQPNPFSISLISELLYHSLAISAWKNYLGNSWALRVNPSSGNLHPTEGYLILPAMKELATQPGVFHYNPSKHSLELRVEFAESDWQQLVKPFPSNSFFIGLSSIHWREAWKYGERAYRYCQINIGHAMAAIRYACSLLGWHCCLVDSMLDQELAKILGIDRFDEFQPNEYESPDLLLVISPTKISQSTNIPIEIIENIATANWNGKANKLSQGHYIWEVIDRVTKASLKQENQTFIPKKSSTLSSLPSNILAATIIRQRRSAVAMDGTTSISSALFFDMLKHLVPALCSVPWDVIPWNAMIHLGIFVHRVDGIKPGLYILVRDQEKKSFLQQVMKPEFVWSSLEKCELPLFLLEERDTQEEVIAISCSQAIAGNGVFSCAMLAEFSNPIETYGSHWYRQLFWETGMIGQILYLEAESKGIRGTGIGCFLDDPVHEIFGIKDYTLQSLYHFTVGGAVDDQRLTTIKTD